MVSFWPWKGDNSSPASFEKALSALAAKISNTQAQLDRTRSTSRRVRVLWTLYLSFAYLVYAIVLVLVVGWNNMGMWEWTGMAGGPIGIYATRTILGLFFNFRIDSLSAKLKDQQTERTKTIQKLKDATKYDSTQELLEKYGGVENKPPRDKKSKADQEGPGRKGNAGTPRPHGDAAGTPNRTGMPPPPTANIPHRDGRSVTPRVRSPSTPTTRPLEPSAEFAPNAFGPGGSPIPNAQYAAVPNRGLETHWYDRIMDLLLGEDETAAKNRIALICKGCRLINGQAPPGTQSLTEIGTWKCMACGKLNGEVDEGTRIVREVLGGAEKEEKGERPKATTPIQASAQLEVEQPSSDQAKN